MRMSESSYGEMVHPLASKSKFCFSSVQLLSRVWLFPTAAHQASLAITNSQSLLKLKSIESVMPSNHLIFCCPLLLLPSIFPSIKVFSSESVLCIRWPEYWRLSFSLSPSNEYKVGDYTIYNGFYPWSGKISHAVEQLSPSVTIIETAVEPGCHSYWSL